MEGPRSEAALLARLDGLHGCLDFIGQPPEVLGQPREHLEFTFWYLLAKNFIKRGDQSRLMITPDGVDYLENQYESNVRIRRLPAVS